MCPGPAPTRIADVQLRTDLTDYYARRAREYETIYHRPERQADLRELESLLPRLFSGHHVLEVACGTGYWTQFVARSAASIVAIDRSPAVLELARAKEYGACPVSFTVADAYSPGVARHRFDTVFCGFWWSHVPRQHLSRFLDVLHSRLRCGGRVVAIDNTYVANSSTPIARTDADRNTYQDRTLQDGTRHEVLKNFLSEADLRAILRGHASDLEYRALTYYWVLRYAAGTNRTP